MEADATGVAAGVLPDRSRILSFLLAQRRRLTARPAEILLPILAAGLLVASLPAALGWTGRGSDAGLADALERAELVAALLAHEVARAAGSEHVGSAHLATAVSRLPAGALGRAGQIAALDGDGHIVAGLPPLTRAAAELGDLVRGAEPLLHFAERAGPMRLMLADGRAGIAAVRNLPAGQLAVIQPAASLDAAAGGGSRERWIPALCMALAGAALGGSCFVHAARAREARRACERMRSRVDTALSRGRCGLWDWDVARGRVHWSRSMRDLLGYPPGTETMTFAEMNAVIHPADGDLYAFADRIAASGTGGIDHEFRARTATGEWLWLRARAEVVIEPEDGSRHLVGIALDISGERGIAERQEKADIRLRDAVEAISEAFVLWDADNRLVLSNSKFRNFHDLPAEAVQPGLSYAEIMKAGRPPLVASHVTLENPDEPGARTLEAQLADGRWLQISERRTKDGGFVSVGTNITALKRNAEQLAHSEQRLIGTVRDLRKSRQALQQQAEQLADLAERYGEQKARAESASRAKSEFLARMSHELRTPLNAVIGFAEVMEGELLGPIGPHYAQYAVDIRQSGRNLLLLIEDILQVSRLETGRAAIATRPIELRPAVERALAVVSGAAEAKGLAVEARIDELGFVEADERALHQILLNLLQNATKFTPEGGCVRVRAAKALGSVNIFIEDNGVGIAREHLPKLCRPFQQCEPEFNRSWGGAGLGLAIARALTEMHRGTLRIRSQQGVGTAVLVRLPLHDPTRETTCPTEPPLKAAA